MHQNGIRATVEIYSQYNAVHRTVLTTVRKLDIVQMGPKHSVLSTFQYGGDFQYRPTPQTLPVLAGLRSKRLQIQNYGGL